MKGRSQLSLDAPALFKELTVCAIRGLSSEADRWINLMRGEVVRTVDGNAPGKPAWRDEVERNIRHISTDVSEDMIIMDVGYTPSGEAALMRALVTGYGSGDKAEGGGTKITAGPPGRSVWDGDLAEKHPSSAQSEYTLPDAFNQTGNQFVRNATHMMRSEYGERLEETFRKLPRDAVSKHTKARPI